MALLSGHEPQSSFATAIAFLSGHDPQSVFVEAVVAEVTDGVVASAATLGAVIELAAIARPTRATAAMAGARNFFIFASVILSQLGEVA